MFSSVQELEELDYTEQRNALAVSMMERKPDDTLQIFELVKAGKFVVVDEITEYCPRTDAAMGGRKFIVSSHDTREEAEAAMEVRCAIEPPDDVSVYISPYKRVEHTPLTDDELPF